MSQHAHDGRESSRTLGLRPHERALARHEAEALSPAAQHGPRRQDHAPPLSETARGRLHTEACGAALRPAVPLAPQLPERAGAALAAHLHVELDEEEATGEESWKFVLLCVFLVFLLCSVFLFVT